MSRLDRHPDVFSSMTMVVRLSVLLHGVTSAPVSRWLAGRRSERSA